LSEFISYGRQCLDEKDVEAVVGVFGSGFLTQGPKVKEFENALGEYCGAKHVVAFSSGTAALHGAYFAGGLEEGDEIITSPMTFMATANAALYLGGRPVFVDIEPDTGNLDAELIEPAITEKTKAVVPVHFAGHPVDMESVVAATAGHDLILIEDACHALGATYRDRRIGDCAYSDMVVFSFHPVKAITTAEGGAVVTDNETYYKRLLMFRHHGITKDPDDFQAAEDKPGPWYHEMQYLGYNYRLSDLHSALGLSQLGKLDRFVERRRRIAEMYRCAFGDNPFFDLPVEREYARSAYHLYCIRLKDNCTSWKKEIFSRLRRRNISPQVHYIPVHLQPYYQRLGYRRGACPNAEDFYLREVSVPLYPSLSDEQVDYVARNLLEVLGEGI